MTCKLFQNEAILSCCHFTCELMLLSPLEKGRGEGEGGWHSIFAHAKKNSSLKQW